MLKTEQRLIQVYPLWQRGQLLLGCGPMTIDCDNNLMGTLRIAWLIPRECGGGIDYDLSFTQPDPQIQNVLRGVWMQTSDGEGIVFNVESILEIVNACDTCCGNSPLLDRIYSPLTPIPPPTEYAPSVYSISRVDNGSSYAVNVAKMDYYGQYDLGTFTYLGNINGTSRYQFASRVMPALLNGDVFGNGSNYAKFSSNEAPPKQTDDLYSLMVYSNFYGDSGPWMGKTLTDIIIQLQADTSLGNGTLWSTQQDRILLLGPDVPITLLLDKETVSAPFFLSNAIGATNAGTLYRLNVAAAGITVHDILYGLTLPRLTAAKQMFPDFSDAAVYVKDANKVAFSKPGVTAATLSLVNNVNPVGRFFLSNIVNPLVPGNTYQLIFAYEGDNGFETDNTIKGTTMALLAQQLNVTYPDNRIGTWTGSVNTLMVETKVTNIYNILLTINQILEPVIPFISNAAPAVPANLHLSTGISLDNAVQYPILSGATVAVILANLQAVAPYSGYGTWSIVETNKIQLETNQFSVGSLAIGANNDYVTNPSPTLTAGQVFKLDVYHNLGLTVPSVVGPTLADIVANIPATGDYVTIGGTWSVNGNQIQLTGSAQTNVYLVLTAIAEPVFLSNVAPAVPVGQRLTFQSLLDSGIQYPMVGIGNALPPSSLGLATIPPFSTYGTWSYPGADKVQLVTSKFSEGVLSLSAKDFFLSNVAPTLAGGQIYQLRFNENGSFGAVDLVGSTLAALITNLPPTIDPVEFGTLAVEVNQIRLTNIFPGLTSPLYVILQAMTSPVFVSNTIGAIGSLHANVRVEIGGIAVYPIMSAGSTGDLVTRLNAYAPFSTMGTWSTSGSNAIQLATTKYNPMTLVLSVSNQFFSNPSPTLTGGQVFRLRGYLDTAFIIPDVIGTTLASLAAKIAGSAAWAAFGGTWSVGGTNNDQIVNTGSANKTLYLYLDAVTAPVFLSNVAPVVPTNQHLTQTVTVGTEITYPILSAGDVAFLRTRTAAIAPYSSMGTWAVSGGDKMQLSGAGYDPITLVLAASDEFISNPIGALTAGQSYQLDVYRNTAFITPAVVAATLADITTTIPTTGGYAGIGGTWTVEGTTQIKLTGSADTGIYLVLSIITTPPEFMVENSEDSLLSEENSLLSKGSTGKRTAESKKVDSLAKNKKKNKK